MKYRFTILILAVMALAGCKKDNLASIPEGAILLTAESHQGADGTKTSVQDLSIQWVQGDQVSLAGRPYDVVFNEQTAYVENFARPASGDFFSYYPADLTASETSVTAPSLYVSSYVGGRQILKQPLVAKDPNDSEHIEFLYVTSSVQVLIKNTTGTDLIVDRVEVSSATQQLCGPCGISFDGNYNLTVTPKTSGITDGEKKVTVVFEGAPLVVTSGGNPVEVQVPILPVGEGTDDLTISVYTHHLPGSLPCSGYTFSRALPNPAIARNQMMTARVLFNTSSHPTGLWFSVSETTKVIFSQANLKYRASTGEWRFHDHQYDTIGTPNRNISSSYNGWIDLFGYGTSFHNSKAPYMTSAISSDYPNVSIARTEGDWGVHNPISNGGNQANLWRTLTSAEWYYLLHERGGVNKPAASTVCGVANARFARACVNGQNGLIIFPDQYTHPSQVDLQDCINEIHIAWTNAVAISLAEWSKMESAGAVFLPAAGYRDGISPYKVNNEGDYWSSSVATDGHRRVMFNNSNEGDASFVNGTHPHYGYAVRLVMDVPIPSNTK
ncbi:MAG: hypothetical protein J6X88_00725 [Bacteroidales bacterium]|nr:hypothetical protein [Bacteroidales bacterium]